MWIESECDCLLGQFDRILRMSDSERRAVKVEKSVGVVGGEGGCGDGAVQLLL